MEESISVSGELLKSTAERVNTHPELRSHQLFHLTDLLKLRVQLKYSAEIFSCTSQLKSTNESSERCRSSEGSEKAVETRNLKKSIRRDVSLEN